MSTSKWGVHNATEGGGGWSDIGKSMYRTGICSTYKYMQNNNKNQKDQ